jgi:uncharacterized protein involved in response to NO
VLSGLVGVSLWPLHFGGIFPIYPGAIHSHLMVYGFFGGFIFGVLGTGLPRMLSVNPFSLVEVLGLFALYATVVILTLMGKSMACDIVFLIFLVASMTCAVPRILRRNDVPPPGFVLVALALLCLAVGIGLSIAQARAEEVPLFWVNMQHLLSYQGFVLLPILGVGSFLLPRFFELPNRHEFRESRTPPPGWVRKAGWALATGLLVLFSFVIEAAGWHRMGYGIRFTASAVYLFSQVPLFKGKVLENSVRFCLALAISLLLIGFLAISLFPIQRVALLHLTLAGGFAMLTFVVATRVIFGHSGNIGLLGRPNRWLLIAVGLMILGMATRISGDFFPQVRVSHYNYGAGAWICGALLWSAFVLPKIRIRDPDDS